MEKIIKEIKSKYDKLNKWVNAKDEETKHDFAMEGLNQLYWKGYLDALKKVIKIFKKDGKSRHGKSR